MPLEKHRPHAWYAIARSDEIRRGQLFSLRRFSRDLVLFRDNTRGTLGALEDRCPHRSVRLRKGTVTDDGCVQCPYHGFKYDKDGTCTHIPASPSSPIPQTLRAEAFTVDERDGIVFMWHGVVPSTLPALPVVPDYGAASKFTHAFWKEHWKTPMERGIENQLDMAHLPFVHRTTIGGALPKEIVAETKDIVVDDKVIGLFAGTKGAEQLALYYPNMWVNLLGDKARVTAFFAPVDDKSTDVYLSFAHRFIGPGLVARAISTAGALFSRRITAQDRPIVEDHIEDDPRREALVQLDVPIGKFRRWAAEQQRALPDADVVSIGARRDGHG